MDVHGDSESLCVGDWLLTKHVVLNADIARCLLFQGSVRINNVVCTNYYTKLQSGDIVSFTTTHDYSFEIP